MALTPQELQAGFRIGECLIEPRQNRIVRGDTDVHVEPRVMNVLVCLAQRAGEVVSRDTPTTTRTAITGRQRLLAAAFVLLAVVLGFAWW
jgi:hypothetical protein